MQSLPHPRGPSPWNRGKLLDKSYPSIDEFYALESYVHSIRHLEVPTHNSHALIGHLRHLFQRPVDVCVFRRSRAGIPIYAGPPFRSMPGRLKRAATPEFSGPGTKSFTT